MTSEGADQNLFDTCAYCGDSFKPNVTYPVATRTNSDGDLEVYSFCDEDCKASWEAEI